MDDTFCRELSGYNSYGRNTHQRKNLVVRLCSNTQMKTLLYTLRCLSLGTAKVPWYIWCTGTMTFLALFRVLIEVDWFAGFLFLFLENTPI